MQYVTDRPVDPGNVSVSGKNLTKNMEDAIANLGKQKFLKIENSRVI